MSTKIKQELLETGETLHCCPQCPFKADKLQMTKVHMLRHSGQFACTKCKKSCRSQKDLNSHMKNIHKEPTVDDDHEKQVQIKMEVNKVMATADKSRLGRRQKKEFYRGKFQCQYCEYKTDRQILLNQHCKYHMNSPVIKHLCPICFKPFPSPYHVKRHIHYNHPDGIYSLIKLEPTKPEVAIKTEPIKTPIKVTKEKNSLTNKKRKRKGKSKAVKKLSEIVISKGEKPTPLIPEVQPISKQEKTPNRTFQCAHCKYSSNKKNYLRQHMTYHSSKYVCHPCRKTFPCAKRLQLHLNCIHDDLKAEIVEDSMENMEEMEYPLKNEITSSLWGFDLSDFGIDAIVLNDEVEETIPPTSPMTNVIPTCSPNGFPNEFNVQTESPNVAETPFSCPFCSYRGKKKRNLDSHMVYHTDKFKCRICSKRHPTLYHLNRHIRLVHGANPEEVFLKHEQDDNQQQSSPSLYFPVEESEMKEESECSLPFNLTDLMAVEATEDLNGTIKLEIESDCDSSGNPENKQHQAISKDNDAALSSLDDVQTAEPNEIHYSVQSDGQTVFFCSDCPYQNAKKQNVKQHRKIHTPQYACLSCGKGHTTSYHLKRHMNHSSCCNKSGKTVKRFKKREKKVNGQTYKKSI